MRAHDAHDAHRRSRCAEPKTPRVAEPTIRTAIFEAMAAAAAGERIAPGILTGGGGWHNLGNLEQSQDVRPPVNHKQISKSPIRSCFLTGAYIFATATMTVAKSTSL
jgi:hypothetical protein